MILLYIFSVVFIVTPFFPATGLTHWFYRTADFVRLQSIAIELLLIILLLIFGDLDSFLHIALLTGLAGAMIYQLFKVYPYTKLNKQREYEGSSDGMVSILGANVLQPNTNYKGLLDIIDHYDPDIVLTMESNKEWEEGLSSIEETYPYFEKVPLDNLYGMHVYSKKKLLNLRSRFQVEDDVPSIFFNYSINDSTNIFFACLHPAPPSPTENETSKEQDAELMITGKYIRTLEKQPAVVCGDMNDVVWSRTTRLFKKMTNMIDPRVGRGFFPTYHAGYRFMRFPLDHLFHTEDLYVGRMERSAYFDSDHFAMYYEIHHKTGIAADTRGHLDNEEKEEVEEKIDEGEESANEN
ncbi:MAG: endonuclease [Flavobacteriaceae bacterium]|nr:endonuclease [Flavobacteriaceae bacterium]